MTEILQGKFESEKSPTLVIVHRPSFQIEPVAKESSCFLGISKIHEVKLKHLVPYLCIIQKNLKVCSDRT